MDGWPEVCPDPQELSRPRVSPGWEDGMQRGVRSSEHHGAQDAQDLGPRSREACFHVHRGGAQGFWESHSQTKW